MSRTTTASKQKPRSAGTPAPYQERLSALRTLMKRHGVEVYLVPSADEHLNEYLPRHTCRREALSGFTGSAGDVAVTPDAAHLFVDSRYHLQAAQEADPALFTLHRLGLEGELELHAWLSAEEAARGSLKVGLD
ncbi:MAG: aminopeptidase P family N-terminal domain-containing protein, partial [Deltaproteobacteria bacterium]|nr:aminopeptidase P family N-terminal domain-containing protein [Deltaproteobacteria bacterium]